MYAGYRGIEWAQTSTDQAQVSNFQQNQFGNTYAFTLQDVMCVTATNSRLSIHQALNSPSLVGTIKLQFEEQKKH
jgi:isocitrate dehydrogenase